MESRLVRDLQIQAKYTGCRSLYLYRVKKALTEHYKHNGEDPTASARRVIYIGEQGRVICRPDSYGVSFSHLSGLF